MVKLILQRINSHAFWQKYPLYINRKEVGKIAFAENFEIELEPGRYQLSVGGFFANEAETWFEIDGHNKAFQLKSESISHFPKNHQLQLIAKGPVQLKKDFELRELKDASNKVIWQQITFNFFYLAFVTTLLLTAVQRHHDAVFYFLAGLMLLTLIWINQGISRFLLRKEGLNY